MIIIDLVFEKRWLTLEDWNIRLLLNSLTPNSKNNVRTLTTFRLPFDDSESAVGG